MALFAALRRPFARRFGISFVSAAAAAASFLPVSAPATEPRIVVAAPIPIATPAPTPAPTPMPSVRPERIEIPALGIDAPIVPVGTESDGAMGTPKSAHEVAWWNGLLVGEGNAL